MSKSGTKKCQNTQGKQQRKKRKNYKKKVLKLPNVQRGIL